MGANISLHKVFFLKICVKFDSFFSKNSSRRRSKSPSPLPSRTKCVDLTRASSFKTQPTSHRVFRATDLLHGEVLGKGIYMLPYFKRICVTCITCIRYMNTGTLKKGKSTIVLLQEYHFKCTNSIIKVVF